MKTPAFVRTERRLANAAGREYRLRLWRPASQPPRDGVLRTLLFLDGQWLGTTLEAALGDPSLSTALAARGLRIASLGYRSADKAIVAPWRAYDYTPAAPGEAQCDPRNAQWPCGGADALLSFLREQVIPALAPDAGGHSTALFGHSYAGLFGLYCRLAAPSLFRQIYAASPSLWWYWPHMLSQLGMHSARSEWRASGATLHLMVGGDERWRPTPARADTPREPGLPTVPFAREFCAALRASGRGDASLLLFEGLAHGPMLHCAARHALRHFSGL